MGLFHPSCLKYMINGEYDIMTVHESASRLQPSGIQYLSFIRPENSPSLKGLDLNNLIRMGEFPPIQRITDLSSSFFFILSDR